MLQTLLTWWLQHLQSLLPATLRPGGSGLPDALVLDGGQLGAPPGACQMIRRRRRRETRLGPLQGQAPPADCIVRLAGTPLLREQAMPAAMEADIPAILAHDMGRLTPFDAAEIAWGWRVVARDAVRKRLTVQLSYVPRRALQPLLDHVGGGWSPAALELVAPHGEVFRLALRPAARSVWPSVALAAAATILLAAAATPFALQAVALDRLDGEIAAMRPAAQQAEALRQRLAVHEPTAANRASEARRVGDALAALAALTNALPDDTVLSDFSLRERKMSLTGTSGQAALLIAALAAAPLARDPAFAAPIVRDPATARDSFSLRAEIAP